MDVHVAFGVHLCLNENGSVRRRVLIVIASSGITRKKCRNFAWTQLIMRLRDIIFRPKKKKKKEKKNNRTLT